MLYASVYGQLTLFYSKRLLPMKLIFVLPVDYLKQFTPARLRFMGLDPIESMRWKRWVHLVVHFLGGIISPLDRGLNVSGSILFTQDIAVQNRSYTVLLYSIQCILYIAGLQYILKVYLPADYFLY